MISHKIKNVKRKLPVKCFDTCRETCYDIAVILAIIMVVETVIPAGFHCYGMPENRFVKEKKMKKVFIDGSEGTTGLRINERFENRDGIQLIKIPSELRKDPDTIRRCINASDITFLCLPDAAAREAVTYVENDKVILIDTSTAHRTEEGWAYGFPELAPEFRERIKTEKRIAVPGCHATGFISLVYPLIRKGVLAKDYPVSSFSLTGYSGGGKKMIAAYEAEDKTPDLFSPREYALTQQHKHLKEMEKIAGLARKPLFSPIVDDYYSGMVVGLPLYMDALKGVDSVKQLQEFYAEYYKEEKFIEVLPYGIEEELGGFMPGNGLSGWDGLKISVTGNEERVVVNSWFDNLGKGASGAAIQCLNIVLGCDEAKGLNL